MRFWVCLISVAILSHPAAARFVDSQGAEIARLNPVWDKLAEFYGSDMPLAIVVNRKYFPFGNSRFD